MFFKDVTISNELCSASFRSDLGATCYSFYSKVLDAEAFRAPATHDELNTNIFLFGNPILFPPNRIRNGKFSFNGREYSLPVNESSTSSFLHGELFKKSFSVKSRTESSVTFSFSAESGEYLGFPHAFSIERSYSLVGDELVEAVSVTNDSALDMPLMLAFHSTYSLPLRKSSSKENCYLTLHVGYEQKRDSHYLPTGEYRDAGKEELLMRCGAYRIAKRAVSELHKSLSDTMIIDDRDAKIMLSVKASREYGYRMIWRGEDSDFICVEPQTCEIDLFNTPGDPLGKGLIVLAPSETKTLYTSFRFSSY